MKRRNFFALLFAPLLVKFFPKKEFSPRDISSITSWWTAERGWIIGGPHFHGNTFHDCTVEVVETRECLDPGAVNNYPKEKYLLILATLLLPSCVITGQLAYTDPESGATVTGSVTQNVDAKTIKRLRNR